MEGFSAGATRNRDLRQNPNQDLRLDPNQAQQGPDRGHSGDSPQHPDLTTATANQDRVQESGGDVPALVITTATKERLRSDRPSDLQLPPVVTSDLCPTSSSDTRDTTCCDSLSLSSECPTTSRRSEDDDTRSVTASSVTSLFHRLQLDPLEKEWLRSSALGNMAAQHQLLAQDPALVLKKDFITTALHWAAKHGRQEAVDLMLRSGADVNVRSGYTALHLASIHGHQDVIQTLIHTYNAKTNIRDYHGRTAGQYCRDVFNRPESQAAGRFCRTGGPSVWFCPLC